MIIPSQINNSIDEKELNKIIDNNAEKFLKELAFIRLRRIGGKRKCEFNYSKFIKAIWKFDNNADYQFELANGEKQEKPYMLLSSYSRNFPPKLLKFIENNFEVIFDDEYSPCHGCGLLVHTQPSHYFDDLNNSFKILNDCEFLCKKCIIENCQEEYLEEIKNTKETFYQEINPCDYGYRKIPEKGIEFLMEKYNPKFDEVKNLVEKIVPNEFDYVYDYSICYNISKADIYIKRKE